MPNFIGSITARIGALSGMTAKISFVALVLFPASTLTAQEAANFRWAPLLDPKASITIRGIQYAPEFAAHDWSIRRATDAATDLTRFEVRPGDQWSEDRDSGENKERSEFDGYKQKFAHGADVWGAYSFLVEPGAEYRSDWTAISQMHGTKVRAFHVHFKAGNLIIYSEHSKPGGTGGVSAIRYNSRLSRNVWHNIVFHLKESTSDDGRLEFWCDGKKIVDFTGAIGAAGNQAYWKFGVYRGYGPIATPLAIQFANMEIGTLDLTARITSPLAIK
ncbi:hypothetical protein V1283_000727 [Bradyrhizobium sp. AZCC 2262]|uniref:heparin lyase I family protein n=1 Tax=Bradyrhizobium sp. AZCC 2262 TaxID=3117022 RepID=UPI002FF11A3C